jgi:acyl-CoA thioesterase-2
MPFDVRDFTTLMTLESHGPDVYVGVGPSYPWGRVYGGQVVAQALRAASTTVDEDHHVHSLHAYFIRGGDFEEPIRYEVDRIRNGRSFVTRRVVARQSVGPKGPGSRYWLRVVGPLSDDPMTQACALAFTSDDVPTEAASQSHPRHVSLSTEAGYYDEAFIGASLDHAIWFHRPGRQDDWVLHDFQGHGVVGARGLSIGRLFSRDGLHLATVAQEILIRERTR